MTYTDTDSSDEDEYEYYNYGTQEDGSFMIAGGGLRNGNAYATIEYDNGYYYCEYGINPSKKYIGYNIDWSDEANETEGAFNII
tara:strand:+ start:1819 stop:2070 length:252 start_codon:yes stop_codon:yes gene_type:complete